MTTYIRDGKRYNTETATKIGEYHNGLARSDFGRCVESLYLTDKGQYFLVGEGGPQSKWAETLPDGCRCNGSGIALIDNDTARRWCERHTKTATIEKYFIIEEG